MQEACKKHTKNIQQTYKNNTKSMQKKTYKHQTVTDSFKHAAKGKIKKSCSSKQQQAASKQQQAAASSQQIAATSSNQ